MTKMLLLVGVVLCVSGCSSLVRKDSDWFEAAGHPTEQFAADDRDCRTGAIDYITTGVPGSDGSVYDGNRAYNGFYSRCMTARHYRSRPYVKNWFE